MSERHLVAILTALLRAQHPDLDADAAVMQAIAQARGGIGESELTDGLEAICQGRAFTPTDILLDVGFALAVRKCNCSYWTLKIHQCKALAGQPVEPHAS